MSPERTTVINGHTVSEYYWAREFPVYVDNQLQEGETYEQVCQRLSADQQEQSRGGEGCQEGRGE